MADRWAVAVPASGDWGITDAWSATDGGASGASVPVATDNVFLKNLTGTLDINTTATCANFDCTGCVGSFGIFATFTVTGDTFKLAAGMTLQNGGTATLSGANAAGDVTLTRAGKTSNTSYTLNGVGKVFKFADDHNLGTGNLTLTNGTLDSQGFDVSCSSLSTNNANTRTLTLTGSVLTLNASFAIGTTTGLTWNAPDEISIPIADTVINSLVLFSSTIPILTVRLNVSTNGVGGRIGNNTTGALSGLVINELRFTGTPSTTQVSNVLSMTSAVRIDKCAFPEGVELISSVRGTQRTVTTDTNEISFDGCMIRDIVVSGGPAIATNSIDLGNNSGITFQNFGPNTNSIVGVTKDNDGAALPSCTVIAFKADGGVMKEVSRTTSHAVTGAYTLPTPDTDPEYLIVATKETPNRADAMNNIVPT
jgi:hypothetical protein